MPVSSEIHKGILVITIVGEYELDELFDAITRGYTHPGFSETTPVLVDSRQSSANPSSDAVRQLCRKVIGRRPSGHTGKWAIVTGTDPLRFGIGRMSSLTMESMGVPVQVFTELNPALTYMRC